ncbi:unnamed protein product [Trypanosoma congolense IL3000]|uniref:WGS project CAEQ00000000 data, annotated contig 1958 n=1 Tax=Trypanosoma congolense (strain IL3000) TaxID=1068625 RepID=F9WAD7_TRYCI|nr:unnamed protein product [Trypanosoma congolense IL3000]
MHGESLATGHACVGSAEADLTPPRNVSRGSNEDGCSADDKDSSECRTSSQVGECSDLTVEGKSASAVVHTMPLRNRGTHSHEGSSSDGGNNCENVYGDSCFVTARSLPGLSVSCTPRTRGVWAGDAVSDGDLTARGFFRSCRSEESAPCSGRWESSSGEGTLGERFHRTIVNNFKIRLPWGLLNASSVEVPMSPTMPSCTSTPRRVVASSCFEDSQCTARDTPLHSLVTSVKFVYDEGSSVTESLPRSSRVPMDYGGGVSARSIAMSDDFRSCQSLAGESAVQSARPSHTNTPGMSSSVTCLTAREGGERDIIAQNNSFDSVVVQQQEDLDTRDQFLGKPSLGFVLRGISRLQNFITLSYGKSNNAGAVEDLLLPEKSDKSFMGFGAVKPLLVASQNKENSAINKILI